MYLVIIIFLIGVSIGAFGGVWWAKRSVPSSPLTKDNPQADIMREDAQVAVQGRIQKRKNRILEKARTDGRITNDGVEDLFCISDRTAGRYLRELVASGEMQKVGNTGRGVFYKAL